MQTQDIARHKRKALALKAIMNNPKLSEAIFDAWDAPLKSSRQAKAKSILASVARTSQVEDGQGGWLGDLYNSAASTVSNAANSFGNWFNTTKDAAYKKAEETATQLPTVVKSIDKFINQPVLSSDQQTKFTQAREQMNQSLLTGKTASSGQTINGVSISPFLKASSTAAPTYDPAKKLPFLGSDSSKSFLSAPGTVFSAKASRLGVSDINHPTKVINNPSKQPDSDRYYTVNGIDIYDVLTDEEGNVTSVSRVKEADAKRNNIWGKVNKLSSWEDFLPGASNYFDTVDASTTYYKSILLQSNGSITPAVAAAMAKSLYQVDPDTELADRQIYTSPSSNPNFGVGVLSQLSQSQRDQIYAGLNSSEKSLWDKSFQMAAGADPTAGAEAAYNAGTGATNYAMTIMGNKKLLASYLGLNESEAAALPEGLLSTQLNDLRTLVDNKNHIDEQLDNLLTLQNRGVSIKSDLENYISGKDEYLGKLDELIADSKTAIAKMDTSDPYVADRMQNYMDYLTILQGRQNKRYTDFLNAGITQHQNDLTIATNIYNASVTRAEKMYNAQAAVTEESYNTIMESLKEAYNAVGEKQDRQIQLEQLDMERQQNAANMTSKVLDNYKTMMDIMNPTTEPEQITEGQYGMFSKFVSEEKDDGNGNKYNVYKSYDPLDVRSRVNKSGYGENAEDLAVQELYSRIREDVTSQTSSGKTDLLNESKNVADEKWGYISKYNEKMSQTDAKYNAGEDIAIEQMKVDAADIQKNLVDGATSGISKYLSQPEKSTELRSALNELAKVGKESWWDPWKITEDSFVKKFGGDKLTDTYAQALYNGVLSNVNQYKKEYNTNDYSAFDYVNSMKGNEEWYAAGVIARNLIY